MSKVLTSKVDAKSSKAVKTASQTTIARLFFLDLAGGRVRSCNPDGSDLKTIVTQPGTLPDGIVVDLEAGHLYWTNMGSSVGANDGSILRANLDGKNLTTIVPEGGTHTPKQLQLDKKNGKLYWCDREGMRVMRVNLDGSNLESLIETGHGDEDRRDVRNWCVGIALDVDRGHVYWTHKGPDNAGQGRICRAGIDIPAGQTPSTRKDIELLYDALPEPIDLDLDLANRKMYWTDRGDPPRGNTVSRAPMDVTPGARRDPEIIFDHLMEGIGLVLDLKNNRMFMTDLGGSAYSANLDGSNKKTFLFAQGNLTGIAYAEIPSTSERKGNPMNELLTERSGSILRVQFNRPAKKNAMTAAMYTGLADLLNEADQDDNIHVVLLHGAGDSFTAGNDLEDFAKNPPGPGDGPQARLINALIRFTKPLVAAVHGVAIGGGTTILTHFDFVYAAESARFQIPFVNLALVPEFGSSFLLPRQIGYLQAAELILLGGAFNAAMASELGLVTAVVPDPDLLAKATETAQALARKPAVALRSCKDLMKRPQREQLEQAVARELQEFAVRVRSAETKEAITAFFEKRPPDFKTKAAQTTLKAS